MVVIDGDESHGLIPMLTLAIIHLILYLELLGFDVWKKVTLKYCPKCWLWWWFNMVESVKHHPKTDKNIYRTSMMIFVHPQRCWWVNNLCWCLVHQEQGWRQVYTPWKWWFPEGISSSRGPPLTMLAFGSVYPSKEWNKTNKWVFPKIMVTLK